MSCRRATRRLTGAVALIVCENLDVVWLTSPLKLNVVVVNVDTTEERVTREMS